jgi:hypothetical protein
MRPSLVHELKQLRATSRHDEEGAEPFAQAGQVVTLGWSAVALGGHLDDEAADGVVDGGVVQLFLRAEALVDRPVAQTEVPVQRP